GRLAPATGAVTAQVIDQRSGSDPVQPGAGPVRDTVAGPLHCGGEKRFLDRILARVELAVAAGEGAEDLRRQPAQQVLERLSHGPAPPLWLGGLIIVSRSSLG